MVSETTHSIVKYVSLVITLQNSEKECSSSTISRLMHELSIGKHSANRLVLIDLVLIDCLLYTLDLLVEINESVLIATRRSDVYLSKNVSPGKDTPA